MHKSRTSASVPADAMQEGVLQYQCKELIKAIIQDEKFVTGCVELTS